MIVRNKGTRYLIEPEVITQFRRRRMQIEDFNQLNFTLDFGFQSTGCVFASNEPYVIVDPPAGWLDARDRKYIQLLMHQKIESFDDTFIIQFIYFLIINYQ